MRSLRPRGSRAQTYSIVVVGVLLAALVFYIPANVLPACIHACWAVRREHDPGGVLALGSWDIAVLIFTAGGGPCTKFLAIGLLLLDRSFR